MSIFIMVVTFIDDFLLHMCSLSLSTFESSNVIFISSNIGGVWAVSLCHIRSLYYSDVISVGLANKT